MTARREKLRVLYVLDTLLCGGAETLVAQWARALVTRGHHVDICTLYTDGPLTAELTAGGVRVLDLALDPEISKRAKWRKYDLRGVARIARLTRHGRYDVVHAHLFPASLFVALTSILVPGPEYVFSEHNAHNRRRRHRVFKLLDAAIYQRYTHVFAVSERVANALRDWLPSMGPKLRLLTNTVDEERLRVAPTVVASTRADLGLCGDEYVVLYAGRLEPAKDPELLLRAAQLLKPLDRPVKILVAGDGPLRGELRQMTQATGLERCVSFLGVRPDIPALLKLADLLVLPSAWEGLPMILLEAMVARTPVLATAVGGIPDVIDHGVNGWLTPPGDAAGLADAIERLLRAPDLRTRLVNNAAETYAARYSFDATMTRLVALYHELLQISDFSNPPSRRLAG